MRVGTLLYLSYFSIVAGALLVPPHTLTAEYWPSPAIGVGVVRPRFGWTLSSAVRGTQSEAYQIQVNGTMGLVWDSGKVAGDVSNQVACGVDLQPDTRYMWRVRWWAERPGSWQRTWRL